MNALLATARLPTILATLAPPMPAQQETPGFLNLINVIFGASPSAEPEIAPSADSKQTADALIRSMLSPGGIRPAKQMQAIGSVAPAQDLLGSLGALLPASFIPIVDAGPAVSEQAATTSAAVFPENTNAASTGHSLMASADDRGTAQARDERRALDDPTLPVMTDSHPAASLPDPVAPWSMVATGQIEDNPLGRVLRFATRLSSTPSKTQPPPFRAGLSMRTLPVTAGGSLAVTDPPSDCVPVIPDVRPRIDSGTTPAPMQTVPPDTIAPATDLAFTATVMPVEPVAVPDKSPKTSAADLRKPISSTFAPELKPSISHEASPRIFVAAAAGAMNDFARSFENQAPQQQPSPADHEFEAPFRTVTETLRSSEPAPFAPRPTAIQAIALRIAQPGSPTVDLHVTERGGEIHVAVRTADAGLQTSLRQDLGTLSNSLERAGYRAQTFVPREAVPQMPRTAQSNFRNQRDSGSSGRGAYEHSQQQQDQRQRRASKNWIQELENLK